MTDKTERQFKSTQIPSKKPDEDLVDLPEQVPQPTWKQYLMTPKFLLLAILAVGAIGRNIYLQYTKPPSSDSPSNQTNETVKQTDISPDMFSRFFWYIVFTVILFVAFILLKRSNDAAEEEKIRAQVKKQQEEDEKQRKIQEKANRILTSMDQFGNVIDESAFKKKDPQASASVQKSQQNKKDK